jgi:hypothetical protein
VRITAAVVEQLRILDVDPDRGIGFVEGLSRLSRDVAIAVPSCLAVTLTVAGLGGETSISTTAEPAPVRASLAVPLFALASSGLLILRAGAPGAFVLLADDLDGLLGAGRPPVSLDEHLAWPEAPDEESLVTTELSSTGQAVGVLVDRGLPPEDARRELQRRAGAADRTVAAVSRELLASLRLDPDSGPA